MLLRHIFGMRGPSQLHHLDLFIWCSSNTNSSQFPTSSNRSHAQFRNLLKDINVQAVIIGRHPCPRLPITPSILQSLGEYGWKAAPYLTMLCYGQHPQPPSLTSVDLEKLQYSVNQSLTHKRTFVFQTLQWTMPFPQIPFPSS